MRDRKQGHVRESLVKNKCKGVFQNDRPISQPALVRNTMTFDPGQNDRQIREDAVQARSLALRRTRFHFDGDHGLIIECLDARGMLGHRFEN